MAATAIPRRSVHRDPQRGRIHRKEKERMVTTNRPLHARAQAGDLLGAAEDFGRAIALQPEFRACVLMTPWHPSIPKLWDRALYAFAARDYRCRTRKRGCARHRLS